MDENLNISQADSAPEDLTAEQREAAVAALGIEFSTTLVHRWTKDTGTKWRVELKRGRAKYGTAYSMGSAHTGKPELIDVLSCLVSDASCVRHGQSFEEFASEMGYDPDSRKAEQIFNACTDVWRGLVRLGLDLDELDRIFQGY